MIKKGDWFLHKLRLWRALADEFDGVVIFSKRSANGYTAFLRCHVTKVYITDWPFYYNSRYQECWCAFNFQG